MTFYAAQSQLPRPVRPGSNSEMDQFTLPYSEGAAIGYKWVERNKLKPLFPFGHGLSYTSFDYGPVSATAGPNGALHVQFTLRNSGARSGMAVGQIYASPAAGGWEAPKRLVGFGKVELAPGATETLSLDVDPRLLATFDEGAHAWRIAPGDYTLMLGASSADLRSNMTVNLPAVTLPSNWRPGQAQAAPAPKPGERGR